MEEEAHLEVQERINPNHWVELWGRKEGTKDQVGSSGKGESRGSKAAFGVGKE